MLSSELQTGGKIEKLDPDNRELGCGSLGLEFDTPDLDAIISGEDNIRFSKYVWHLDARLDRVQSLESYHGVTHSDTLITQLWR